MEHNLPQKPSASTLKKSLDTVSLRKAVHQQLEKDLECELGELDYSGSGYFEEILEILLSYFSKIIDNQPHRLANIIYRVDINERKLRRILDDPHDSSANLLAEMTLQRIMLKVFYRNVYNGTIQL